MNTLMYITKPLSNSREILYGAAIYSLLFSILATFTDYFITLHNTINGLLRVYHIPKTKLNSVALVRERTIPTERPPLVGEVSANVCG
jgi:hypothetical protein